MKSKRQISLHEAAETAGVAPDQIIRFISFEWIVPEERTSEWQRQVLDDEDVARARLICELQEEFGVNDAAVPIILHLVDQLNALRKL
jgi:chaperone modulatory protein CbpM